MPPTPHRFIHVVLAWMMSGLIGLTLLDAFTLEVYFVVSLIGVLIVTEFMTPVNIRPQWHRRLRWVILLGLAGFSYIVLQRLLELLPVELTFSF